MKNAFLIALILMFFSSCESESSWGGIHEASDQAIEAAYLAGFGDGYKFRDSGKNPTLARANQLAWVNAKILVTQLRLQRDSLEGKSSE